MRFGQTKPKAPSAYDESLEQIQARVGYAPNGLTSEEAERRLSQFGYNEIPEERRNPFLQLLGYFWGPIPVMIEVAGALSAVLGHWTDVGIVGALLLMNAVVAFREEYSAADAVAALKQKLATRARVKRDGAWTTVPARDLVPGDLVRLRIGDVVPADVAVVGEGTLDVDESALTGESLPVAREHGQQIYSSSIIQRGEAEALVYGTGLSTFYGKTTELVATAKTKSHLQQAILKIADYLILIALALSVVVISVAFLRGDSLLAIIQFTLLMAIASVPVAMPAVMTVTMALGSRKLSAQEAIVTRLEAIEELASIDTLCADKTGTLTKNELQPGTPYTVVGVTAEQVLEAAALASHSDDPDAIDKAVLAAADHVEVGHYTVVSFVPFDPVRKRSEAVVEDSAGTRFQVAKGAPQVIVSMSANAKDVQEEIDAAINGFAARGFRALGVARADDGEWKLLGIIPLFDPLRDDTKETVETAERMGVHLKMVTGDQLAIARETARQLGLAPNITDASAFVDPAISPGQLADRVEQADGFAQVFPEHKYRIVESLQQRGHVVGMTGDGVNDAPALKKADAGIAVARATDAARAAADIVLLQPGLSVVIDALKESRRIFQRMVNYAIYRITETIRVLLFLTLAVTLFNLYPITAVMIVLLAILNDGAILSIAYDNTAFAPKPERWNMRMTLGIATVLGVAGVISSFLLFYLGENVFHLSRDVLQTLIYLKMSVAGHLTVFVARTRGPFWSVRPSKVLVGAIVGTQVIATFIAVYGFLMTPLGWGWAGIVWGYAFAWFFLLDIVKLGAYRLIAPSGSGLLVKPEPMA